MNGLPVELILTAVLLGLGLVFGMIAERRHYRSIRQREAEFNSLPAIASRFPPTDQYYGQMLVGGSVVIGSDYFKTFAAGLVNLLGGRVRTFESLLDRGRREALLRVKAEAKARGARYVFNVKYETATIGAGGLPAVEVLAYGTALVPVSDSSAGWVSDGRVSQPPT